MKKGKYKLKELLKEPRNIVILIIAISVVVIIAVLIYINAIWKKDNVKVVNNSSNSIDDNSNVVIEEHNATLTNINKYTDPSIENNEVETVSDYFNQVKELLVVSNYDALFEKVDKNYLTSKGFDKNSLYDYLIKNNLIGNSSDEIVQLSIQSASQENNVTIYRIKYKMKYYIGYVNLIETFPYEYTISFLQDTIPTVVDHNYTRTVNGITFEITERIRREGSITYRVKITNNNEEKVEFNFNTIANVGLVINNNSVIKQTSTSLSSRKGELTKESYLVKNMYFPINMQYQNNVTAMIFYNVKIGNNTNDLIVKF